MTPSHDTQVMGPYQVSSPLHQTSLAAKSEDYTTEPQHLQFEVFFSANCTLSTSVHGAQQYHFETVGSTPVLKI